MGEIMTKWESTSPNPDEKHLKALWQAEMKNLKRCHSQTKKASQRRRTNILAVLKKTGLSHQDIAKVVKEEEVLSREYLKASESQLAKPPFDIEILHEQHLKLVRANADRMKSKGNPDWSGYIWHAVNGGFWKNWEGDSTDIPEARITHPWNRFVANAKARGKGCFDLDFSEIHAYLVFKFNPPSWGRLYIYTCPWVHGFYHLYANDEWFNDEYACAELHTWCDVHQNFWRVRQYRGHFRHAGPEFHPFRGRLDTQYTHEYLTDVGEGEPVTIRVGIRLYCSARANGSASLMHFIGDENYVHFPYIFWNLIH